MERSPKPRARAFATMLALLAASGAGGAACSSEPCIGEACPASCNGTGCDQAPTDAAATGDGNRFGPCASSSTCDELHGFACVRGACRHACRSHFDCAGSGLCEPLSDAEELGTFCDPSAEPSEPGRYYARCPDPADCDEAHGFICIGAGEGDLDGYCSSACSSDADCPTGFQCDPIRIDEGGTTTLLCVPRGFCSACERDVDCLALNGGLCAPDGAGGRICTLRCDLDGDSCPWGNAGVCEPDSGRGMPTCVHRFGACRGSGAGCHPCVRDGDCPSGTCFGSSYTGERWCVDLETPCSCAGIPSPGGLCLGNNGCPLSPSGLRMACVADQSICIGANANGTSLAASTQLGCWER